MQGDCQSVLDNWSVSVFPDLPQHCLSLRSIYDLFVLFNPSYKCVCLRKLSVNLSIGNSITSLYDYETCRVLLLCWVQESSMIEKKRVVAVSAALW